MCRLTGPQGGQWRSGPAPRMRRRRAAAPAKQCLTGISWSWAIPPVSLLRPIVVSPVPTSMRKRVEFPVRLDLPPAMRKPVRLEHQKRDDDQTDRDLAQERDVVVE